MNRIVFLCIAMLLPLSKLTGRALFTADSYYPRFKRHNLKDTERGRPKKTKPVMNFFGNSQVVVDKQSNQKNDSTPHLDTAVDFVVQECHSTINQLRKDNK